jgi:murein DD-endopeptidase MepM/ murein hydrolase activator NlpD
VRKPALIFAAHDFPGTTQPTYLCYLKYHQLCQHFSKVPNKSTLIDNPNLLDIGGFKEECLQAMAYSEIRRKLADIFGLYPWEQAWDEAKKAIKGDPLVPPAIFDHSSLKIFKPTISFPTWLGIKRSDHSVPIYNFFNRIAVSETNGYSVKVRQVRDFLGGEWTYESHQGTDFAVPVYTPITTAAQGIVRVVMRNFDRGGLKVGIDHGRGLFTTYSHLSETNVRSGQVVGRGQVIGHSGASGLEFVMFFPFVAPHLHFNVWLNGEAVDPFSIPGSDEISLWRKKNFPEPVPSSMIQNDLDSDFELSTWNQ